jgi:beta-glucosidase
MWVLVTGPAANSMAIQSGGWTISWQGTDVTHADFPNGQTIWEGIKQAVAQAGGNATLSADGSFAAKPDVAIVIYGEEPYAEFQGDRPHLDYMGEGLGLDTMKRLKAAGIPVVAVFLSGRPLWVNRHINAADAFVAAWLPGSEGGGVADLLFGKADFTGKLPFSWPADAKGAPLNVGDADYRPLYPFGFGLALADRKPALPLSEDPGIMVEQPVTGPIFGRGRATGTRLLQIDGANDSPQAISGAADNGAIAVRRVDRDAQEDAREIAWSGKVRGTLIVANPRAADLSGAGPLALTLDLRVDRAPPGPAMLELRCGPGCIARLDIGPRLAALAGRGWQTLSIPLACLPDARLESVTAAFALSSSAPMRFTLSSIALTPIKETSCR